MLADFAVLVYLFFFLYLCPYSADGKIAFHVCFDGCPSVHGKAEERRLITQLSDVKCEFDAPRIFFRFI